MMRGSKAIVGVFTYLDDAIKAIGEAKKADLDIKVYAPTYIHDLDKAATGLKQSPIRRITATGAVIGIISGFSLACLCSLDWPLRVSAKDILSIPGFVVIGYECTILFGAIFTLLGVLHLTKMPALFRQVGYDPRFSDDKFGVVVGCESNQVDSVKKKLLDAGADEVQVREGI